MGILRSVLRSVGDFKECVKGCNGWEGGGALWDGIGKRCFGFFG